VNAMQVFMSKQNQTRLLGAILVSSTHSSHAFTDLSKIILAERTICFCSDYDRYINQCSTALLDGRPFCHTLKLILATTLIAALAGLIGVTLFSLAGTS
jgi:hypothetical protein